MEEVGHQQEVGQDLEEVGHQQEVGQDLEEVGHLNGAGETSLCMQCCHHVHMLNMLTTFVEVGMFQIDDVTWHNTLGR